MSSLRERMIHDMQLRGYGERTREAYARAVRQLQEFCQTSPPGARLPRPLHSKIGRNLCRGSGHVGWLKFDSTCAQGYDCHLRRVPPGKG